MQLAITNAYLKTAWATIVWVWNALRASVAAFLQSKQVWFAAAVFAFCGYYGGFLVGARHVPTLKADIHLLEKSVAGLTASNRKLVAENERLSRPAEPSPVPKAAPAAKKKAPAAPPAPKAWWQP